MPPHISQDPRDFAFGQNPYPFYARVHAAGGVVWWEEYGMTAFARFGLVSAIMRDRRFGRAPVDPLEHPARLAPFCDFEALSMLEQEGPAHARLRSLATRAFVSRQIETLTPRIAAMAHELIDALPVEADLIAGFCEPIPVRVIAALLGVPESRAPDLLRWSHAMVAMYRFGRGRAEEDAAVAATLAFSDYLREKIAARRAAPRGDLLTHLIEAGDLTEAEVVATAILILNAGHEASVHALGNGVKTLIEQDRRPSPPDETAEEILRFDPPLHVFTRYVYEDMEFGGVDLKRGEQIALLLAAAGRDPAKHEDPDVFRPGRPEPSHVAFSAGAHFCLGAALARLEMRVALPILFDRRPDMRIIEPPRYADRYHFHGLERLMVRSSRVRPD